MKDIFLVDADDTLLDFFASSSNAIKEAFLQHNIPWKEEYATSYKQINDRLWSQLERKEITRTQLIDTRFSIYLSYLGLDVDANSFNQIYLHELATKPVYVEGAEAFLKTLRAMGKIYIVTNGTERIQKSRFSICKLYDYVDDVFISQAIGFDKPAKGYTDYVLSHIPNFSLERAVWIGDSISADIRAAQEANITSIWFNPKGKSNDNALIVPIFTAKSFAEVLEYVRTSSIKK